MWNPFESKYAKTIREGEALLNDIRKQGIRFIIELQKNKDLFAQFQIYLNDLKKALIDINTELGSEVARPLGYDERKLEGLRIQQINLINLRKKFGTKSSFQFK